jgi:putative chitinase
MGCNIALAQKYAVPITSTMEAYEIDSPPRQAAFLAQIGHETVRLSYVRELASGKDYEGRKDLGNTQSGDGVKFKGRGLIQITGRNNYLECGLALGLDLINNPMLLEAPYNAAKSAGWFWDKHNLNALADLNMFSQITKIINGGYNGLLDREALYDKAKSILTKE